MVEERFGSFVTNICVDDKLTAPTLTIKIVDKAYAGSILYTTFVFLSHVVSWSVSWEVGWTTLNISGLFCWRPNVFELMSRNLSPIIPNDWTLLLKLLASKLHGLNFSCFPRTQNLIAPKKWRLIARAPPPRTGQQNDHWFYSISP